MKDTRTRDAYEFSRVVDASPAKHAWGTLLMAMVLLVLPSWGVWDAREYLRNYFAKPMEIQPSELRSDKRRAELRGKKVEVRLRDLRDSGFRRVILRSWGDSSIESEVSTEAKVLLFPMRNRFLVVLRNPQIHSDYVCGALVPVPEDLSNKLAAEYGIKVAGVLFEDLCLDEFAYQANGPYLGLAAALAAAVVGLMLVMRGLKRVRQAKALQREGAEILKGVFAQSDG